MNVLPAVRRLRRKEILLCYTETKLEAGISAASLKPYGELDKKGDIAVHIVHPQAYHGDSMSTRKIKHPMNIMLAHALYNGNTPTQ